MAVTTIELENDKKIVLDSSAGWLYKYRHEFGEDILPRLMPALEAICDTVLSVASKLENVTGDDWKDIAAALDHDTVEQIALDLMMFDSTTVLNMVWAMAKNHDNTIPGPEEWINTFDAFPLDLILPAVWKSVVESCVSSKNRAGLLRIGQAVTKPTTTNQ